MADGPGSPERTRWARARTKTPSLTWRREVLATGLGGGLGVVAVAVSPPSGAVAAEAIIVCAALLGALLLRPVELAWNYLWAPWHEMRERVERIEHRGGGPERADPKIVGEKLVLVLRDLLRQGRQLEAFRHQITGSYRASEQDELEDWTHDVVEVLIEWGQRDHARRFIDADAETQPMFAAHRLWARARVRALEEIVAELERDKP